MPRLAGSGLYSQAAVAVERLLAAALSSDVAAAGSATADLALQRTRGYCGMSETHVAALLNAVATHLNLPIVSAAALPVGGHADVVAHDGAGTNYSFEVKAQTTKELRHLVEADWIRQETDWLAAQASAPAYAAQLPPVAASALGVRRGLRPSGWSDGELLASDLALLPDPIARAQAGVATAADLSAYAARKWLVQIAQDGARLLRIADLPLFQDAILGRPIHTSVVRNAKGLALRLRRTTSAQTEFTYHVYDRQHAFVGRHKMHARAVQGGVVFS